MCGTGTVEAAWHRWRRGKTSCAGLKEKPPSHRRLLHQDHHQEHLPFQSLPSLCQQPTVAGRNFHQDKVITSLWYGDNMGSELPKQTTATRIKNVINNAEDGLNPHQAYSAYLLTQAGLFENIPALLNKAIVRRHCMGLRIELYPLL